MSVALDRTQQHYNPGSGKETRVPANPGTRIKALMALGAVSILWGTTWVASRQGVQHMPALQLSSIRLCLAGSLFLLYFLLRKSKWPKGREWITVGVLAFFNLFLTNSLTTWGVKFIPAGLASIIAAIYPLWLVFFSHRRGRLRFFTAAFLGLLLGFGGICVLFYEHLKDLLNPDFRFGIAISWIASLSWALGTIFTKRQVNSFNPYFSICLQMILSGIAIGLIASLNNQWIPLRQIPARSWIDIIYLAIFGSILGFLAFLYALKHLPAEQVSIYAYLNPVVAVVLGIVFFSEKFTFFIGLGGTIALLGVFLVNRSLRNSIP
jgi:drug/metabolite transporter (DMT)-like permease